jgi:hypothetical protein
VVVEHPSEDSLLFFVIALRFTLHFVRACKHLKEHLNPRVSGEPDNHQSCAGEDVCHHGHLVITLFDRMLIYAQLIYPVVRIAVMELEQQELK